MTFLQDPCTVLSNLGQGVHDWLSEQISVGEESIADWLLYQISKNISCVRYIKFNRLHEARGTGADWD